MKTTVELPDQLMLRTRQYAAEHKKTFKDVLTDALNLLISDDQVAEQRPGWEALFGAFRGDSQIGHIDRIVAEEFSRVDPEAWP